MCLVTFTYIPCIHLYIYVLGGTLRFSSGGTKSVLHTDSLENMHCLVAGQKEFIMIPPQYAKVIGPEWATQGYFNMDVEQVNMTAYPGLVDVPWYKTVLQEGDCLYIPYKWVHHVSRCSLHGVPAYN